MMTRLQFSHSLQASFYWGSASPQGLSAARLTQRDAPCTAVGRRRHRLRSHRPRNRSILCRRQRHRRCIPEK